jgi:TonB family protein
MSFPVLKSAVLSAVLAAVSFPAMADAQTAGQAAWSFEVRQELAKVQRYPSRALDLGIEGTVKLRIEVGKQGDVTGFEVAQSSGSALLDKAALGMVKSLDRLPAIIGADSHTIVVPVAFRLSDDQPAAQKKDAIAAWRDTVRRRVANTLSYPADLVADGVEGRVKVRLTVDADGSIAAQEIAQSSGHEALDAEALLLANRIGKLPSLPVGQEPGDVVLPVVYKIAENR